MSKVVRVAQASQPSFGRVRVGVVLAGIKDGVPTARLLLRGERQSDVVDLTEGNDVDLFGEGRLALVSVHPSGGPACRDEVTLRYTPAETSAE